MSMRRPAAFLWLVILTALPGAAWCQVETTSLRVPAPVVDLLADPGFVEQLQQALGQEGRPARFVAVQQDGASTIQLQLSDGRLIGRKPTGAVGPGADPALPRTAPGSGTFGQPQIGRVRGSVPVIPF